MCLEIRLPRAYAHDMPAAASATTHGCTSSGHCSLVNFQALQLLLVIAQKQGLAELNAGMTPLCITILCTYVVFSESWTLDLDTESICLMPDDCLMSCRSQHQQPGERQSPASLPSMASCRPAAARAMCCRLAASPSCWTRPWPASMSHCLHMARQARARPSQWPAGKTFWPLKTMRVLPCWLMYALHG